MMPRSFISRITFSPKLLTPSWVLHPRAEAQMSVSPVWQSVMYTTPRWAKCFRLASSRSMASPFSMPSMMLFLPLRLSLYKSAGVRAMLRYRLFFWTMDSILSKMRSAYCVGVIRGVSSPRAG